MEQQGRTEHEIGVLIAKGKMYEATKADAIDLEEAWGKYRQACNFSLYEWDDTDKHHKENVRKRDYAKSAMNKIADCIAAKIESIQNYYAASNILQPAQSAPVNSQGNKNVRKRKSIPERLKRRLQAAASRVNKSGRYFETPEEAAAAVFAEYEAASESAHPASTDEKQDTPKKGQILRRILEGVIITVVGGLILAAILFFLTPIGDKIKAKWQNHQANKPQMEESTVLETPSVIRPTDELPEAAEVK